MMTNNLHLFIFLWAILPLVIAIRCYDCLPGPSGNLCTEMANFTDCDTAEGAPLGKKFDACGKVSYEMSFGDDYSLKMNVLQCAVKSMCNKVKEKACNATFWQQMGMNMTRCEINCCTQEKCNCPHPPCFPVLPPWLQDILPN